MQKHFITMGVILAVLVCLPGRLAHAQAAASQDAKPAYTMAEYNAFQAANSEKDPVTQIKLLDDFTSKYPNSTLNTYLGQVYAPACGNLAKAKNYTQAIACDDKVMQRWAIRLATWTVSTWQSPQTRVQAFSAAFDPKAADANDQLTKERDAALLGAKLLGGLKVKPKRRGHGDGRAIRG